MAERDEIHLPAPSALPIALSLGIALVLFGFVPDSRLWRLARGSVGAPICAAVAGVGVRDSLAEFRDLD